MRIIQVITWGFTFFLFTTLPTQATTFVNRMLGDVVKESPYIVRGKAGESYYNWDKIERRAIYTYTHLTILEVLKGNLKESQILLRQPGGSKDGIEMSVPGTAHFMPEEEVVVIISEKNQADGSYDVPGFTTGKYKVLKDDTGELILESSLGGGALYDPRKDPRTLSYNSRIPLEVFRRIAKGQTANEEKTVQFQPQSTPSADLSTTRGPQVKGSHVAPTQEPEKETTTQVGSNWWLLIGILIVVILVGLVLWKH